MARKKKKKENMKIDRLDSFFHSRAFADVKRAFPLYLYFLLHKREMFAVLECQP